MTLSPALFSRAAAAVFFLALAQAGAAAGGFRFPAVQAESGAEIQAAGFYSDLPPFGYAPVRLESWNGRREPLRVVVTSSVSGPSPSRRGHTVSAASWALTLPPGNGRAELLVPLRPQSGGPALWGALSLNFSGPGLSDTVSQGFNYTTKPVLFALLDESLPLEIRAAAQNAFDKGRHGNTRQVSAVDFQNGPSSWLGLAGADQVWMTEAGWERLEGSRRTALRDWVLRGGALCLVHPARTESAGEARFGLGRVTRLAAAGPDDVIKGIQRGREPPGALLDEAYRPGQFAPRDAAGRIVLNWGLLLALMFALVIIAGPVNLFVLAGGGNRHRLFLTTPLISLGAGAVFLVIIILQDGIGGALWRQTLVVLVSAENREVTITEQASRTGLLLSGTFQREPETLVLAANTSEGSGPEPLSVSESPGGMMSGWFQSRSVSGLQLQRVRPSRARVEFLPASGGEGPWAVSTAESDLLNLNLVAADGSRWRAARLPAGGRARLEAAESGAFRAALEAFHSALGPAPKRLVDREFLSAPGSFFAKAAEAGPLAIATLPLRAASDEAAVCGVLHGFAGPLR